MQNNLFCHRKKEKPVLSSDSMCFSRVSSEKELNSFALCTEQPAQVCFLTIRPCGHHRVFIVDIVVVHIVARFRNQRIVTIVHVRRAEPKITIAIQSLYAKRVTLWHIVCCHFLPKLLAASDSHTVAW